MLAIEQVFNKEESKLHDRMLRLLCANAMNDTMQSIRHSINALGMCGKRKKIAHVFALLDCIEHSLVHAQSARDNGPWPVNQQGWVLRLLVVVSAPKEVA